MYYPRSFLKFILLGFLLVSLPLIYALAELILSLDQLQAQGQAAVQQAAQAGRASRQLVEQSATLERLVRQFLILEDSTLLDDYGRVRQEFLQTRKQLASLPLAEDQLASLERLADSESQLHKLLAAPLHSADAQAELANGYSKLVESAQLAVTATNDLTDRAILRLQEIASQGREKWLYLTLATAGIALALAILFAVLIARPIRQLDQAIRQMGTADFTHAIEVNGPQDLRYLGQRLEWLRTRLHDLEEQQNRFLRHVSHELKTPLTAVREGAELLRDNVGGKLSTEQRDIVRIVRENTLSLQKLIEDLLTYHQTRAMEPQTLGPVFLPDVVGRVVREHKLAALARMIAFETNLKPAQVIGDGDKIRTVIDNLVSNAIKYSPRSGAIRIDVSHRGRLRGARRRRSGAWRRSRRPAEDLRVVLPGQGAGRGPREGIGTRPRDRARIRARTWRANRGPGSSGRPSRRSFPPDVAGGDVRHCRGDRCRVRCRLGRDGENR